MAIYLNSLQSGRDYCFWRSRRFAAVFLLEFIRIMIYCIKRFTVVIVCGVNSGVSGTQKVGGHDKCRGKSKYMADTICEKLSSTQ